MTERGLDIAALAAESIRWLDGGVGHDPDADTDGTAANGACEKLDNTALDNTALAHPVRAPHTCCSGCAGHEVDVR